MSLFKTSKVFLVVEEAVEEIIDKNIFVTVVWRKIAARNKEEAVGKFINQTKDIRLEKRLGPIAYEWSEYRTT